MSQIRWSLYLLTAFTGTRYLGIDAPSIALQSCAAILSRQTATRRGSTGGLKIMKTANSVRQRNKVHRTEVEAHIIHDR